MPQGQTDRHSVPLPSHLMSRVGHGRGRFWSTGTCPISHTQLEGLEACSTSLRTAGEHTDPGSAALVLSDLEPSMRPSAGVGIIIFFNGRVEEPPLLLHAQTGAEATQRLWRPGNSPPHSRTHPAPSSPLLSQAHGAHSPGLRLGGDRVSAHTALEAVPGLALAHREATSARPRAEHPLPET